MAILWPFLANFAFYINNFHKTEIPMVILRCYTGLNHTCFKNYDPKGKYFRFQFFKFCKKHPFCLMFFAFFSIFAVFLFLCNCVITNERLNLSFAEDLLVIGKKMTRKGRKTAIYQSRKFWWSVSISFAQLVLLSLYTFWGK